MFALLLGGCDDGGDGSTDAISAGDVPLTQEEPQPGPVCDFPVTIRSADNFARGGELWTYVDGRPVLQRRGFDGVKTFQQRWGYDDQGRMISRDVDLEGDETWDEHETWTFAGEHLVGYTRDGLDAGAEPEEIWSWTWDAQGRITLREADLNGDGRIDYRETSAWPTPNGQTMAFDMDGDGTDDIFYDITLDNQGHGFSADRTGRFGNLEPRTETMFGGNAHIGRSGSEPGFSWDYGVRGSGDDITVLGGKFESCTLNGGRVTRYQIDDDGVLGTGTYDLTPQYPVRIEDVVEFDARGNMELGGTYDEEFVDSICGGDVPEPPMYPWPVVLDNDFNALDPLCWPEYLECRFRAARWRAPRC